MKSGLLNLYLFLCRPQKVKQKAATISCVKPRAERKPPATDFLSELKLGITLRRVKDKAYNPYAVEDPDESQA